MPGARRPGLDVHPDAVNTPVDAPVSTPTSATADAPDARVEDEPRSRSVRFWTGYARLVIALRWVVVVVWVGGAIAVAVLLKPFDIPAGGFDDIGAGDAALEAETRSSQIFGFPLISRVAMVQHDPDGMEPVAQAEAVARAVAVTQGEYDTDVLGAVAVPSSRTFASGGNGDTSVLTWLFMDPRTTFFEQTRAARDFAEAALVDDVDAYVGVTGSVPARVAQAEVVNSRVHVVEVVTLLAVLLIVGFTFRSLAAPVMALVAVGTGVVLTLGAARPMREIWGITVPADLRPLIVALLLGIVTDYCIFYLSSMRTALLEGRGRRESARRATAATTPIVLVAGLTVAAGTAALVVAKSELFRTFGPGLALTVLVGMGVCVSFVPALLAITGGWVFRSLEARVAAGEAVPARERRPSLLTRTVTRRGPAAVLALVSVAGLGVAAYAATDLRVGLGFVQALPPGNPVADAADAASEGFVPGIVSPTELLLEGDGIAGDVDALGALGAVLAEQPGVAAVVAPGSIPELDDRNLLVAPDADAARFLLILDTEALEPTAIAHLADLRRDLPDILAGQGLGEPTISIAGDTALAGSIVDSTRDDLVRIAGASLLANLLMLVVFLRSLVAPLYLLACSVLALSASLGLTVLVFQGWLGQDGITFYVPFAAAVLLLSLGSDYNIFAVGRVWQLARDRPLRDAMRIGVPESTRAITAAGIALATSFGLLALVPLQPFRELGFVLAVGILLDVFVVRALLVPALLTLVGPVSGWPSRRLRTRREPAPVAVEARAGA